MGSYKVTVRDGPRVESSDHASLDGAIAAIAGHVERLLPGARRKDVRLLRRTIEAARQVAARIELSGPGGLRGGIDIRGDGSTESYTGRWRRVLIERRGDESELDALRRTLAG